MQMDQALPRLAVTRFQVNKCEMSDYALVASVAVGDKTSMKVLFARHRKRVYRFTLRLIRDESLAEDILSEVFVDAWQGAAHFKGRSKVSTWLLAIARNKVFTALRQRRDAHLSDEHFAAIEDPADNPEVAMEKRLRSLAIQRCLQALSPAHREVIDLVYYHGKSIAEVAEIMSVPEATVKTRMFYARGQLAGLLRRCGIERACA